MSSEIILYDLPTRGPNPTSWSLNPWKARASLNYKGLAYKTEWTEYPDLASKFKGLGIPPNDPGSAFEYSSPVVRFPDGTFVMDSRKIAVALDKLQPEPSLHTDDGETIDRCQTAVAAVMDALRPILMLRVAELLLPERSAKYFHETRAKKFGMSLQDLAASDTAKNAWTVAEPKFKDIAQILGEKGGPFVLGETPSFADFVIAGYFRFVKKTDQGDVFDRAVGIDARLKEHVEACGKWLERED